MKNLKIEKEMLPLDGKSSNLHTKVPCCNCSYSTFSTCYNLHLLPEWKLFTSIFETELIFCRRVGSNESSRLLARDLNSCDVESFNSAVKLIVRRISDCNSQGLISLMIWYNRFQHISENVCFYYTGCTEKNTGQIFLLFR